MSWHPAIPNEVNIVRTASGDLTFMRENFDLLSGVATLGISGLLNASGTNATADKRVVSFRSSTGGWIASGLRLDRDLFDVTITSPTSGQALTYNGTVWVNATPVQTISGLMDVQMNPPTPLSGQALVYSGTHPTGKWTPSGIQITNLDSIGDVTTPAPVSGDVLMWNGTAWVNVAAGPPARVAMIVSGTAFTLTGQVPIQLPLNHVPFTSGNFGTNTTSGTITVSAAGYVNVYAQVHVLSGVQTDAFSAEIRKNGLSLSGVAGYGLIASGCIRQVTGTVGSPIVTITAPSVPVASGDVFSLWVQKLGAGGATDTTISGAENWLYLENASKSGSGGGSGGGSSLIEALMILTGTQTVTTATNHVVSGYTSSRVNGLHISAATASGAIIVSSANTAITHVELRAGMCISGHASAAGQRQVWITVDSGATGTFADFVPTARTMAAPTLGGDPTRFGTQTTLLVPITAGVTYHFKMNVRHEQGSDLVIGNVAGIGSAVYLHMRGYTLT